MDIDINYFEFPGKNLEHPSAPYQKKTGKKPGKTRKPGCQKGTFFVSHGGLEQTGKNPDFQKLLDDVDPHIAYLIRQWLPGGRPENHEWVALNPTRPDRKLGSFKINTRTGKWADFATGDKGRDIISLKAYLDGCSYLEAARSIYKWLNGDSHA